MYKSLLRPLVFKFDSEDIHDYTIAAVSIAERCNIPRLLNQIPLSINDNRLNVKVGSLNFSNPIGLAAGFDKQAVGYSFFESLGFGCIEVGTITSRAQPGNPKPRIFRLEADEAIINRMGFPSLGIQGLIPRLKKISSITNRRASLGINIGKAKDIPLDEAAVDYQNLTNAVAAYADYIAINVSSPNTPDLRKLQQPERLKEIFSLVRQSACGKPIFVKLAPDIEEDDLTQIINTCKESKIDGLIATNTTITRPSTLKSDQSLIAETGGLSGRPLTQKAVDFVSKVHIQSESAFPIIGVGGIFNYQDVLNMMKAGASAVQVYTGLIYEGPFIARTICQELVNYLDQIGAKSLKEAIS
jgi:dihydroorotate dehydrogenase